MRHAISLVGVLLLLAGPACDATDGGEGPSGTCDPGVQVTCHCIGGGVGAQTCAEGGLLGPCVMHTPPEADPAGAPCEPLDEYSYKGCHENDVFWFDECGGKTSPVETCSDGKSCVQGTCIAGCLDESSKICDGNRVVWLDSCGTVGETVETCPSGSSCTDGQCLQACVTGSCTPGAEVPCTCADGAPGTKTCQTDATTWGDCACDPVIDPGCTPEDPQQEVGCYDNDVVWIDDCGDPGALIEACVAGVSSCVDGTCVEGADCTSHVQQKCKDGTSLHWYDSCGNPEEVIQVCPQDTICSIDECIEACAPHDYQGCQGNDVYWFDSCDTPESMVEKCESEDFCVKDKCSKAYYNGTWSVSADPNTKALPGGLGTVTFQTSPMTLEVTDGVATLTDPLASPPIVYTGTVAGKVMTLDADYIQVSVGQTSHVITKIIVSFSYPEADSGGQFPPTVFEGSMTENVTVTVEGMGEVPLGNIVWNITGLKQ